MIAAGRAALASGPSPMRSLLYLLAYANFVVGMGAFVVIGVLSPIAVDFSIDRGQAGAVMTVYAIVYAVSSPLVIALTGRLSRAAAASAGLLLFVAGAAVAAAASSFPMLLAARAVMAVGGGLLTPVAASVGVAVSAPTARGHALAVVFGGLTLAQVLGVPVGAWVGYAAGWRAAFVMVCALGLSAALLLFWRVSRSIDVPTAGLGALLEVIASGRRVAAVAFTAFFMAAAYVPYTFLAPLFESRFGLGRDGVSGMLLVFGAGAVLGNWMGGFLTDRVGPRPTLFALCAAQLVLMPALTLTHLPLAATTAIVAVWSLCTWSFMVPQQARLAALDPSRVSILFALNAAAIYVGASLGSFVGGFTLRAAGLEALGPAGAAWAVCAALSLLLLKTAASEGRQRL